MKIKYLVPAAMLMLGHEILSLLALILVSGMFLGDVFKEVMRHGL